MIGGSIITMVLAGILGLGQAENNSTQNNHIQSVTSVCKVLGDGRKVAAVVIEYDTPIKNASLGPESFPVEGKEVVRIYANAAPELSCNGSDGRYVIIEVKAEVNLRPGPPLQSLCA